MKLVKLKPEFQKKIFYKLIKQYNGSISASNYIQIPPSSIRAYKNLYFNSVQEIILNRLVRLGITSQKEITENVVRYFKKEDQVKEILNKGREKRINQLKTWKEEIPQLSEIISKENLDFERWFSFYIKLINFGSRKFNYIHKKKNLIEISYITYSKGTKKDFILNFPRKIKMDSDFSYFLGLWCGDKSGGKRFGIINQNEKILDFTKMFLERNFQKIERILYLSENTKEPLVNFDKKVLIKTKNRGWAISLHTVNGILSSFFFYLLINLDFLLEKHLNLNAFFAGLFDAEGNVSLYNKSFRWACKDEKFIKIYSKFLNKIFLYEKYDGASLISHNRKEFFTRIFPYLKHFKKINHSSFLCTGERKNMPLEIKEILIYLKKNPLSTQKEIAKALKKPKVYSELSLLKEFDFISSESYPLKYKLNKKIKNISGD